MNVFEKETLYYRHIVNVMASHPEGEQIIDKQSDSFIGVRSQVRRLISPTPHKSDAS